MTCQVQKIIHNSANKINHKNDFSKFPQITTINISLVNTVYSKVQMRERKRLERAHSSTEPLSTTIGHVVCLSFSR